VNAAGPVQVPGVPPERVWVLDASGIARRTLGREIPNVPMLAAVAVAFAGLPAGPFLSWLEGRLARELPEETARRNLEAARLAVEEVQPWLRTRKPSTVGR
jgi:Pyruvate/2-oxoacid:ferredoxin oxidoreductase gamma subunit